jgi:hypothetical protein
MSLRAKIHLSPFVRLCGRPFLSNDLVMDPETDGLLRHITDLGTFQQAIQELGNKFLPAPTKAGELGTELGEKVLIKTWKEGSPDD